MSEFGEKLKQRQKKYYKFMVENVGTRLPLPTIWELESLITDLRARIEEAINLGAPEATVHVMSYEYNDVVEEHRTRKYCVSLEDYQYRMKFDFYSNLIASELDEEFPDLNFLKSTDEDYDSLTDQEWEEINEYLLSPASSV